MDVSTDVFFEVEVSTIHNFFERRLSNLFSQTFEIHETEEGVIGLGL